MAHHDDEFGVFSVLEKEAACGTRIICIYTTDGGAGGVQAQVRERESITVLKKLGIAESDIISLGSTLKIRDGYLYAAWSKLLPWLDTKWALISQAESIYIPAWEGGHPDHDLLHVLITKFCATTGARAALLAYPLYNGFRCPLQFFNVLTAIEGNGEIKKDCIRFTNRVRYLWLCCYYKSQWKTWIGLLPFVALYYLFRGEQQIQITEVDYCTPPHVGQLYYEKRKFLSWRAASEAIVRLDCELQAYR